MSVSLGGSKEKVSSLEILIRSSIAQSFFQFVVVASAVRIIEAQKRQYTEGTKYSVKRFMLKKVSDENAVAGI